jgi:hypothetical protein
MSLFVAVHLCTITAFAAIEATVSSPERIVR